MHGRDWDQFLIPYEQAVEELKVKFRSIRSELKRKMEYSPIEFVTGRVKKVSSILEKAKKLGIPQERPEEVPDIAGIRIMVQFVDDIYRVVQLIHQRNGKDMTIVEEKDYVKNTKESGYRSYHIVIRYPLQTANGEKSILAEIQIRTLAMNFWATIEHSLSYKYQGNIPQDIKDRLRNAAEAAFRLDEEMSQIREEIREAQRHFEMKSNQVLTLLRDIERLYDLGRVVEAITFQKEFHDKSGDLDQLTELAGKVREALCSASHPSSLHAGENHQTCGNDESDKE
ncbi:GTP pyrophosphokinase [Collibacillus ludicampi]|uniref:GTP diphosphokinase n=1 Tax=Collibacillus ludicampi TaxID=2771369 RepID=A0AAV4LBK9_9BACL|nr:GTP pyrophosphokinase family protein [Collibacillus ludicampi]GIM45049.1 GTP pyrophosphokinase [Collibacillus ludicampi]